MSPEWTTISPSIVIGGAGGPLVVDVRARSRSMISAGCSPPSFRAAPSIMTWNRKPLAAILVMKFIGVCSAPARMWAAAMWTDQPATNDGSAHWSGFRSVSVSTIAARSRCVSPQICALSMLSPSACVAGWRVA